MQSWDNFSRYMESLSLFLDQNQSFLLAYLQVKSLKLKFQLQFS